MRRLLLALCLLFWAGAAHCEDSLLLGVSNGVGNPLATCPSQALTYFASLATQPTAQRKLLYCKLINALLANGVWQTRAALHIYMAADQATALTPLIGAAPTLTATAPTFTADHGFAGNGTSSYVNTNVNLSTSGNYSQNSGEIAIWDLTSRGSGTGAEVGAYDGTTTTQIAVNNGGSTYPDVNSVTPASVLAPPSTAGWFSVDRSSSSSQSFYYNGAFRTSLPTTSSPVPNLSIYVGARAASGGGASLYSTDQIGIFMAGLPLTSTQESSTYAAFHAYAQAVAGVP